jgi:hypothetical protein
MAGAREGNDSKKAGNPAARGAGGESRAPDADAVPVATVAVGSPAAALPRSVEPKPAVAAAAPSAAPPARDLSELRARLAAIAEHAPRDQALVEQVEVLAFTGDSARVSVRDDGGGRYLAANPEPIRALLSRAAGRSVRVTVESRESPRREQPAATVGIDDASVRNDPIVRKAMMLFDATIVGVASRALPTVDEGSQDADATRDGAAEADARAARD